MYHDFSRAELLATKLCHDLASAISAANNAVELMLENNATVVNKEALDIAESSARQAVDFLNFFRFIYSAHISYAEQVPVSTIMKFATSYFNYKNINSNIASIQYTNIETKFAQLLLNLMLISSMFLLKGGQLEVFIEPISRQISIIATGKMLKIKPDIVKILLDDEKIKVTPDTVQVHFTKNLVTQMNLKLEVNVQETQLRIMAQSIV